MGDGPGNGNVEGEGEEDDEMDDDDEEEPSSCMHCRWRSRPARSTPARVSQSI